MKRTIQLLLLSCLCLSAAACSRSKRDQCVTLIRLMKAEALATGDMAEKKPDALSAEEHARFIETTIAKLRGMDFKEKQLNSALKSYIAALGALKDLDDAPADLAATLTYLESSRRRVADECNR